MSTLPVYDILSYVFADQSEQQPWTSAITPSKSITNASARLMVRRLGAGLDRMGVPKQTPIMVVAPVNMYTPILYLAIVGSGRIFTAADPTTSVDELVQHMIAVQPGLVLADPATGLENEKVFQVVEKAGLDPERIFSFEEDDWFEPKKTILDWKILMARPTEGRQWQWQTMDEAAARKTFAVIDFANGQTSTMSHYDVVANARKITHGSRWQAALPWTQSQNVHATKSNDKAKL